MEEKTSESTQPIPGSARLDYSKKGIRNTLLGIAGLMIIAIIFGAISMEQGRGRRNDGVLPRNLEYYAVIDEDTVRYGLLTHPAELVMVDDDADFEPYQITMTTPLLSTEDDMTLNDIFGGTVTEEIWHDEGESIYQEITLQRELRDGQYFGLDIDIHAPSFVEDSSLTLAVAPQEEFAQKMIVIGLPGGGQVGEGSFEPYRVIEAGGWTLYYFDVSLLDSEETITLTWESESLNNVPAQLTLARIDNNR